MTNILLKMLKYILQNKLNDQFSHLMGIIKSIFLLDSPNISNKSLSGKIKENPFPIKSLIEESNNKFCKYIIKVIENFPEKNCHLNLNMNFTKNFLEIKGSEFMDINIYHFLFYKLLKLLKISTNKHIINEVICLLSRVFRINGKDFLSFVNNIRINFENMALKKLNEKKKYDKESFLKFGSELNETNLSFLISKTKSSNLLSNNKNLIKGEEENSLTKDFDCLLDFFLKFNENDVEFKFDIAELDVLPKIKAYFKKSTYFVYS